MPNAHKVRETSRDLQVLQKQICSGVEYWGLTLAQFPSRFSKTIQEGALFDRRDESVAKAVATLVWDRELARDMGFELQNLVSVFQYARHQPEYNAAFVMKQATYDGLLPQVLVEGLCLLDWLNESDLKPKENVQDDGDADTSDDGQGDVDDEFVEEADDSVRRG